MTDSPDAAQIVEEAWLLVQRAQTAEDRARALSTFRRSIATATKALGEVTPELADRITQLEDAAGALFDDQRDAHVRRAIRALASLRMAVEARLDAKTGGERVAVQVVGYGEVLGSWETDLDGFLAFYGIPHEHANDRVVVQLTWGTEPDVRVYRGRKIVWRRPAKPSPKPRRRKPTGTAHRE